MFTVVPDGFVVPVLTVAVIPGRCVVTIGRGVVPFEIEKKIG